MNKIDHPAETWDGADAATHPAQDAELHHANPAQRSFALRWSDFAFIAGVLALALPTMIFVARSTWSTEEGGHGPIILATGLWLLWHKWPEVREKVSPPPGWHVILLLALAMPLYLFARITQIVEIEGYAMYLTLVVAFYGLVGWPVIKALAFPLFYLAFVFPPPETVIYTLTLPIKIAITKSSIALLQLFGMPIGGTGVTIQIGQYQLLVAAACSGLNSIVSLSALTLFYIYLMHQHHRAKQLVLFLFVIPVAIMANFIRVLTLILLTYFGGEAVAQGFLHDVAGITMFILALLLIFLIDILLSQFFSRRRERAEAVAGKEASHG